jgi:tRNA(Ile)-lysidine synthase
MARRALAPACLEVVGTIRDCLAAGLPAPIRVAVSGGADSLALAAGTAWLAGHEPGSAAGAHAVVVDHGLQPGSAEVAARAAEAVEDLGLAASVVRVEVAEGSPDGVEAAAREARYTALTSGSVGTVLLGHTLDDQAETVLLGLARGSGTRSLAGMAKVSEAGGVVLARPLLGVRRDTTRLACAEWGLDPWDDPMNDDERFARVAVRRSAIPALAAALGDSVPVALARTAELARQDADLLDELAAKAYEDMRQETGALPVDRLRATEPALRSRVVRQWLLDRGANPPITYDQTRSVLALVDNWHGQGEVALAGVKVRRAGGYIQACRP